MCKRLSKRICILSLVLCFTFVQVTQPPQKVHAMAGGMEIVIGGGSFIALETALAWLLGILGFTAVSAAIYENRDALMEWGGEMIDNFGEFCEDAYDQFQVTASDAREWLEQVASGTLDKASSAYDAFKAWAYSVSQAPDAEITEIVNVSYDISQSKVTRDYVLGTGSTLVWNMSTNRFDGYPYQVRPNKYSMATGNVPLTAMQVMGTTSTNETYKYYYTAYEFGVSMTDFTYHPFTTTSGYAGYKVTDPSILKPYSVQVGDYTVFVTNGIRAHSDWINTSSGTDVLRKELIGDWLSINVGYVPSMSEYDVIKYVAMAYLDYLGLLTDGFFVQPEALLIPNENTQSVIDRDGTLDNIDIVSPYVTDTPDVITLPWDKVGTLAPDGTYDLPLDNTGTLVTDIPIALPVDTTTDTTLDTDIPIDDAITVPEQAVDTSEVNDYTVTGLESFFPFCIPFDFINFLNVLDAEPETPRFEWEMTFLEDLGFEPYTFVIDLSIFDGVAVVARNMELLLFIVGLIIATRSKFIQS